MTSVLTRVRVRRSATAGDDGAARIRRALCSARARSGGYRQRAAGGRHSDFAVAVVEPAALVAVKV